MNVKVRELFRRQTDGRLTSGDLGQSWPLGPRKMGWPQVLHSLFISQAVVAMPMSEQLHFLSSNRHFLLPAPCAQYYARLMLEQMPLDFKEEKLS